MSRKHVYWVGLLALGMMGCGKSATGLRDTVPVTGRVLMNGQPLGHATVTLIPTGDTKGGDVVGVTDAEGDFELRQVNGAVGSPPGRYKVIVSRYTKPDGTPIPFDSGELPANLGAVESLPPHYSNFDQTELQADIPEMGAELKFELKT
jgi:hypothetical protein